MTITTWLLITYLVLNTIIVITSIFLIRKLYRKETYAIIQRKDGDNSTIKINPNHKSFTHKEKLYIIPQTKTRLRFWRKHFIIYDDNNPNPIQLSAKELHPKLSSEALYSVVYTEALKILNRPKGLLGGLDIKKIAIIGAIAIIGYMVYTGVMG
jgi:hypothetical protein